MTTSVIRKKLITFIADADDKKVKGLYMLIKDEIGNIENFWLEDKHFKILEEDRKNHVNGKSKSYSREEAKEIILGKRKL